MEELLKSLTDEQRETLSQEIQDLLQINNTLWLMALRDVKIKERYVDRARRKYNFLKNKMYKKD